MNAQDAYGKKRILAMQCSQEDVERVRIMLERVKLNTQEQILLLQENQLDEFGARILSTAWLDAGANLELHPEHLLKRMEYSITELLKSLGKFNELVEVVDDLTTLDEERIQSKSV
jgi:hypothetical protein